jgi:hypothetical protein
MSLVQKCPSKDAKGFRAGEHFPKPRRFFFAAVIVRFPGKLPGNSSDEESSSFSDDDNGGEARWKSKEIHTCGPRVSSVLKEIRKIPKAWNQPT